MTMAIATWRRNDDDWTDRSAWDGSDLPRRELYDAPVVLVTGMALDLSTFRGSTWSDCMHAVCHGLSTG